MSAAIAVLTAILFAAPAVQPPQAHFTRAQKLFAQGKYRDALDEFTAASEAAPSEVPALWFDIGQCHRNLGNARQAVASFRRYLALEPEAPDREQVIAMIGKLGGNVDDLVDPPAETPEPPPATPPPPLPPPVVTTPAPTPATVALTTAPPPPPKPAPRSNRWKLWLGLAGGFVAATAIAVGVGVGVGLNQSATTSMTTPMPMPMPTPTSGPTLGTPIVLDTRGH